MGHSSRRLSILAFICVLSLLLTVLLPVISQMRESSRRGQCLANLRELAQSVRSYHNTQGALPPLVTAADHWTWLALLMPHVPEMENIGLPELHRPALADGNRDWLQSVRSPRLYCPTRRFGVKEPTGLWGQPTDYAAVSTTSQLVWSPQCNGPLVYCAAPPTAVTPVRSRTSLRDIIDGETLTALLGEKHMRPAWLWGEYDQPALVARNDPNTIRIASDIESKAGVIQEYPRGLAGDSDADEDPFKFGGPHPGVCFFAMVDGSVRPVRNSVDSQILRWLCGRNDHTLVVLD